MRESTRTPLRAVLGNRQLLRLLLAYAGSAIAEWALWLGLLVYAFERGGSATAGATAVGLLIPAALVAPTAGRLADGPRPQRVLVVVFAVQTVSLAVVAVLTSLDAPASWVVFVAAVPVAGVTFVRPALSVVVPSIVVAPGDLVAANLLTGNADSVCVLVGPLLASALIVLRGPALVLAVCAAITLSCVVLTVPVSRGLSSGDPAPAPNRRRGHRELVAVVRSMSRQRGSSQLLVVVCAEYALIGGLDLLYVNLAFRVLDLGDAGAGYLNAAFGAGAVLGGLLSFVVVGRHRLAPPMIAALGVIGVAMCCLGAWTTLTATLVVLPLTGVCRSLVDVSSRMLLQRSAPQDVLASVFAVVEVVAGLGILLGTVVVQVLVAIEGVEAAVIGIGVLLLLACSMTAAGLRHADEHADAPVVEVRLLRRVPLFAPLPGPALERLARTCSFESASGGDRIVREGDVGDRYFVVAGGVVEASVDGVVTHTLRRGEGFGEIALLAGLPRTATVTALIPTSVLAIQRSEFLSAVAGHDASAAVAWAVARSLHPPLRDLV